MFASALSVKTELPFAVADTIVVAVAETVDILSQADVADADSNTVPPNPAVTLQTDATDAAPVTEADTNLITPLAEDADSDAGAVPDTGDILVISG